MTSKKENEALGSVALCSIAGEVKRVPTRWLVQEMENGHWKMCQCCGDIFSTKAGRIYRGPALVYFVRSLISPLTDEDKLDQRYKYDSQARVFGMPIRDGSVEKRDLDFCCPYCQQLAHRQRKRSKKQRLLRDDFLYIWRAKEIVAQFDLKLKDGVEDQLLDIKCIDIFATFIHKFRKGLWRICANPDCPDRHKIYYTDRRFWYYEYQGFSHLTKWRDIQDGDRLIGLLDMEDSAKEVSINWKCCSDKCRAAYLRAKKKGSIKGICENVL